MIEERKTKAKPRALKLIATEVKGLEALVGATPASSPQLPALLRRLAEGYVEMEVAASRDAAESVATTSHQRAAECFVKLRGSSLGGAPSAAAGAPTGRLAGGPCKNDMDCQGDKLCANGACVAPN